MKRIIILTFALAIVIGGYAQTDSIKTDKLWSPNLFLGLSASATLYGNGYDMSPYYTKYAFALHMPLLMQFDLSPHWRVTGGLQYDWVWSPLYHRVETTADGEGIDFPSTPQSGTQHGMAFHGYMGVPLKIICYPFSNHKNDLWLALDVHPAYAVTRYISLNNETLIRSGSNVSASSDEEEVRGTCLRPWKLEVGLTIGTSRLGLVHGVRFFGNLLPTYTDVITGEKIHTVGMSLYL